MGVLKVEDGKAFQHLESFKETANMLYKDAQYDRALKAYTKGLDACAKAALKDLHLKATKAQATTLQATLLNNRAACYMASSKSEKAVPDCEAVLKLDPANSKAALRLAKAHLRLGRFSEAKAACDAAIAMEDVPEKDIRIAKLERNKVNTLGEQWAKALVKLEVDPAFAVMILDAILAQCPEAVTIRLRRIEGLLDQAKVAEAKKAADELWKEVDSSQANVYGVLGECVLSSGDADRGAKMITEALKHDIDNRTRLEKAVALVAAQLVSKDKGNELFKAKSYDAAIDAYGEGLQVQGGPLGPTLRCNRAACYMALKQYNEAISDCTEALEQDAKMEKALRRRAQCYTAVEDFQKAVHDHETLVEINSSYEHRKQLQGTPFPFHSRLILV